MDGMILGGNVALVTGASRGLGAAIAIALAGFGAHVVIAGRDDDGLTATDDAIRAAGGEATLLPADLAKADVTDAIGAGLYDRFGRLDILVHAAIDVAAPRGASLVAPEEWDRAFGINAVATWRLIRTSEFLLRRAAHGRVVVVTHGAGAVAGAVAYRGLAAASLSARQALVMAWAGELERTALRVNLFDHRGDPVADAAMVARLCLPSEMRHGVVVAGGGSMA